MITIYFETIEDAEKHRKENGIKNYYFIKTPDFLEKGVELNICE